MVELKKRWALVTGASRGVGKQIAKGLASYGCNVILHSRNLEHTRGLAEELEKQVEVKCIAADLANKYAIAEMLKKIDSWEIQIDIVYNVAGVNSNVLDFFHIPLEHYEIIFQVNVFAVMQICNHFIPYMLERGFGRVINLVGTFANQPKAMAYGASKDALKKLSTEMGYAVNGTDIMVNMASPGWVRTDMGTENAPNPVESCLPGVLLGAVMDDYKSGRTFHAGHYYGLSLEEAYEKEKRESCCDKPDYLLSNDICVEKVCSLEDFKNKYAQFIASPRKKVVFGGGNQARFVLDILHYLNCQVDAVLCTKRAGQKMLRGVKIYQMEEFPFDTSECDIIVAITEQHMPGVIEMLKAEGWNVMTSYSVLYTHRAWADDEGKQISDIYLYKCDTFTGNGIGK